MVKGQYVADLFKTEMQSNSGLRFLHHLSLDIINPSQFSKMHVRKSMKFISVKTAGALETAVAQQMLPREALTTAWFIRLLAQWFQLVNSRKRACSITSNNFSKKENLISEFVDIIQETVIGKGWKPLNTGSILTSLSFIAISRACFDRGYKFVLGR